MTEENKSNEVLLPCPFCGGTAKMKPNPSDVYSSNEPWWLVVCSECGATVGEDTTEDVIAKWNRRDGVKS